MATVRATFFVVDHRSATGSTVPVGTLATAVRLATVTTSSTSAVLQAIAGGAWSAPASGVVQIESDGNINVAAGTDPTASATVGVYLSSKRGVDAFAVRAGDRVAVVDA